MQQEFRQIEQIKTVAEFRRLASSNSLIRNLPDEITQAVIQRHIHLDGLKEIIKLNDKNLNKKILEIVERKKKYEKRIVSTAKQAITRKRQMKKKMKLFDEIVSEGVLLSTVWDFGKRNNYAGDPTFYGNAPTQVVEQCIIRLTKPGDLIVDVMAGSGTTIDVSKQLNRMCIGYDLNPIRHDIIKNDSRTLPLRNETVDMVFLHFPYWDMVKYSNDPNDLSGQDFNEFLRSVEAMLTESKRVLKKDKYVTILIGDMVENGKFVPITRKIANIAESLDLEDCGNAIKITANSVSQMRRGKAIYAELAYSNNLKINHDTVMFWKKN